MPAMDADGIAVAGRIPGGDEVSVQPESVVRGDPHVSAQDMGIHPVAACPVRPLAGIAVMRGIMRHRLHGTIVEIVGSAEQRTACSGRAESQCREKRMGHSLFPLRPRPVLFFFFLIAHSHPYTPCRVFLAAPVGRNARIGFLPYRDIGASGTNVSLLLFPSRR